MAFYPHRTRYLIVPPSRLAITTTTPCVPPPPPRGATRYSAVMTTPSLCTEEKAKELEQQLEAMLKDVQWEQKGSSHPLTNKPAPQLANPHSPHFHFSPHPPGLASQHPRPPLPGLRERPWSERPAPRSRARRHSHCTPPPAPRAPPPPTAAPRRPPPTRCCGHRRSPPRPAPWGSPPAPPAPPARRTAAAAAAVPAAAPGRRAAAMPPCWPARTAAAAAEEAPCAQRVRPLEDWQRTSPPLEHASIVLRPSLLPCLALLPSLALLHHSSV
ncbi:unnamed protein product [Closterium sp. NIES-53]